MQRQWTEETQNLPQRSEEKLPCTCKNKEKKQVKIRKTIRKQLGYAKRNLGYIDGFLEAGHAPTEKEKTLLKTIRLLYEQQEYMYSNHTHSAPKRIVSIQQPYLRPIVRGKAEKLSFDLYYPEKVLVDQIYRTRDNRDYCKGKGIRMFGPKLGRPSKNREHDKAIEYQDNVDRIEVERTFSLSIRCYGMGLIKTKLEETTRATIALSVFVTNLFKIQSCIILRLLCRWLNRWHYELFLAV